jgi:hypothetical protein
MHAIDSLLSTALPNSPLLVSGVHVLMIPHQANHRVCIRSEVILEWFFRLKTTPLAVHKKFLFENTKHELQTCQDPQIDSLISIILVPG